MKFKKLFIPGPTEVRKDVLERVGWPMISHRGSDFMEFFNNLTPKLKRLLATKDHVFVSTIMVVFEFSKTVIADDRSTMTVLHSTDFCSASGTAYEPEVSRF